MLRKKPLLKKKKPLLMTRVVCCCREIVEVIGFAEKELRLRSRTGMERPTPVREMTTLAMVVVGVGARRGGRDYFGSIFYDKEESYGGHGLRGDERRLGIIFGQ